MLQLPVRWKTAAQARHAVASQLHARHFLRVHAFILFVWTFCIGNLTSKVGLALGLQTLTARYMLGGLSGYFAFLLGVRVWLWYVDVADDRTTGIFENADVLELAARGTAEAGGDIVGLIGEGIGASAAEGCLPMIVLGILTIIAVALMAVFGPELLIEVAFEAVLAGSLVGAMRLGREPDWLWAAFRKTIWIFLFVIFLMAAFGGFAQKHYPSATTTKQVIHLMMH
jgi:hypothetical protein